MHFHTHDHRGFGHRMMMHRMGRHGHGGRGGRGGGRMFQHGDLRLLILALIAEAPRHGYEMIREIESRLGGAYAPSPGVVYPTLTMLEELGYVTSATTEGSKRQYTVTPEGTAHLAASQATVDAISPGSTRPAAAPTPARASSARWPTCVSRSSCGSVAARSTTRREPHRGDPRRRRRRRRAELSRDGQRRHRADGQRVEVSPATVQALEPPASRSTSTPTTAPGATRRGR